MYPLLSPLLALNSLLVLKRKVNLDILYQIISTLSIRLRLLSRPVSPGSSLLFLVAHHIPATLPSCRSFSRNLRAFAPALSVASACYVLSLHISAWLALSHRLCSGRSTSPLQAAPFLPVTLLLFCDIFAYFVLFNRYLTL